MRRGVLIEDAPANVVGGQIADSGNVIGGNTGDGIVIENSVNGTIPSIVIPSPTSTSNTDGTGNIVQGNDVGFNERNSAVQTIPNLDGVFIASSGNLVGGNATAAQNLIVANLRNGITIAGVSLDAYNNQVERSRTRIRISNVVEGNFIGTVSGSDEYGNRSDGIFLDGAADNTLGGSTSAAANVISGNTADGVEIQLGGENLVAANVIGTTSSGSSSLGNGTDGVSILNSPANIIGGTTSSSGNVIAGTGNGNGVELSGANATATSCWGNSIGTNSDGADLLGNSGDGVAIDTGASNNTIGGTLAGAGNTIAFNAGAGVGDQRRARATRSSRTRSSPMPQPASS